MTEPTRPDEDFSLGGMVSDVAAGVTRLLRQEVELAKTEIRTEAGKAATAARLIAGGALALHITAVLGSVALVFALHATIATQVPALADQAPAVATGVVALLWLILGLSLLGSGRRRLRRVSPIPQRTIQTLREDIAWLRKPTG